MHKASKTKNKKNTITEPVLQLASSAHMSQFCQPLRLSRGGGCFGTPGMYPPNAAANGRNRCYMS